MDNTTTTYTKTFSIDLERANYHLKLKKRKTKRILIIAIVWILLIVYFVTPLSKVNLKVSGNVYYTKEELINMGYINKNNLWWLFEEKNAIKALESYEYINNVKIKKSFFGTKMEIDEIYPVATKNGLYVLNNGDLVNIENYPNNSKINKITSFNLVHEDNLIQLSNKYSKVNIDVRNRFNELEIISDSYDYKYVKLYGHDEKVGYFVIKVDLVYLDTKFKGNKYDKIIDEIGKNNVKYDRESPCLVAYHDLNEEEFFIVDAFEEE